ncbi:MAG: FMN adenylyltransferase / Riboflavin kinase [uncultured Rubrobacteraceae bacterium]|uniref:Riboflavin biosynthesis protein n=1 Tax=uncultured Rubrobacteraceae bacterium TaxID=349277 RepID=A0A6J4PZ18_9ACTN|nr:MAG: FMN adenylyltransferase / Riboflavin kinase [uncultured Rubrobacteraceae bacterium]
MRAVVVALGNFDGVHLGHRSVLARAGEEARRLDGMVVAATFWPHPRSVLGRGGPPGLLTTLDARREGLLRSGADEVRVIPFDEALSKKSPRDFVEDVLVGDLGATSVVVGENFRFGYKASGDVEDLARIMREHGGDAHAVEVWGGEAGTSSTRIRGLLLDGEVAEAAELLGRPYAVQGEVVVGDRRGKTIGFATANVRPDPAVVVPERGVYACTVRVGHDVHAACTNVGVAPTFERGESRIEAHLLDFDEDLYGQEVEVLFVQRIRGERRFGGVEELKEQIGRDVEEARRLTEGYV